MLSGRCGRDNCLVLTRPRKRCRKGKAQSFLESFVAIRIDRDHNCESLTPPGHDPGWSMGGPCDRRMEALVRGSSIQQGRLPSYESPLNRSDRPKSTYKRNARACGACPSTMRMRIVRQIHTTIDTAQQARIERCLASS